MDSAHAAEPTAQTIAAMGDELMPREEQKRRESKLTLKREYLPLPPQCCGSRLMTRLHNNGLAIRRSYFLAYLTSGNPRSPNIVLGDR